MEDNALKFLSRLQAVHNTSILMKNPNPANKEIVNPDGSFSLMETVKLFAVIITTKTKPVTSVYKLNVKDLVKLMLQANRAIMD